MKTTFALIVAFILVTPAFAKGGGHSSSSPSSSFSQPSGSSHSISGYTKSNGTYGAPSHATNPNATKADNWTTKGNINPHTGKPGTKSPD